jgi:hypothetical protein
MESQAKRCVGLKFGELKFGALHIRYPFQCDCLSAPLHGAAAKAGICL